MFRGSQFARVDEKGRLKLPADFTRQILEEYGGQFYITSRDGETAEIHPMREWEKYEEKLAAVPNSNLAKQKLVRLLNYYGHTVEMDAQGRVLLPQVLREKAELIAEVVVSGNEWHLEVMNRTRYDQKLQLLTTGDLADLEKYGA